MRRMIASFVAAVFLTLGGASLALADEPAADTLYAYKKVTTYDMGPMGVDGVVRGPSHEIINIKLDTKHGSLIHVRVNFVPEMYRTVHDI